MVESPEVFLSAGQIAARLRISQPTVQGWLRSGKLKGVRISGRWQVSESELAAYLEKRPLGQAASQGVVVTNGRLNYRLARDGKVLWFEVK
jgi:excisionase family DNA binding protein